MNKTEYSSFIDCFVESSETIGPGVIWVSVRVSPFDAFLIVVSIGK
jgi:hypothetical protein